MAGKFLYKSNHTYKYAKTPIDIILFFKNTIFYSDYCKIIHKKINSD